MLYSKTQPNIMIPRRRCMCYFKLLRAIILQVTLINTWLYQLWTHRLTYWLRACLSWTSSVAESSCTCKISKATRNMYCYLSCCCNRAFLSVSTSNATFTAILKANAFTSSTTWKTVITNLTNKTSTVTTTIITKLPGELIECCRCEYRDMKAKPS